MMNPEMLNQDSAPGGEGFGQAHEILTALNGSQAESVEARRAQTLAERHPNWPQVRLIIQYGRHDRAHSVGDLRDLLVQTKAKVFMPEGYDGSSAKVMQEYADGLRFPPANVSSFNDAQLNAVYDTGVVVGHMDTSTELDPELVKRLEAGRVRPSEQGSFAEYLSAYEAYVAEDANNQNERESLMPGRFETDMERIFEENPLLLKLREQNEELVAVARLGADHVLAHKKTQAAGITTEHTFSVRPYTWTYSSQAFMGVAAGRHPSPDRLAKAYFTEAMEPVGPSVMGWDVYMRDTAKAFTTGDIEEVYEAFKQAQLRSDGELGAVDIEPLITAKGLPAIPRSDEEGAAYLRLHQEPTDGNRRAYEQLQAARRETKAEEEARMAQLRAWIRGEDIDEPSGDSHN